MIKSQKTNIGGTNANAQMQGFNQQKNSIDQNYGGEFRQSARSGGNPYSQMK